MCHYLWYATRTTDAKNNVVQQFLTPPDKLIETIRHGKSE